MVVAVRRVLAVLAMCSLTSSTLTSFLCVCGAACDGPVSDTGSARGLPRVLKRYIVATNTPT